MTLFITFLAAVIATIVWYVKAPTTPTALARWRSCIGRPPLCGASTALPSSWVANVHQSGRYRRDVR